MEIKGVTIQNEENYYKILSVTRNNKNITVKEIIVLNSFLNGKKTEDNIRELSSDNNTETHNKIVFSGIKGLAYGVHYSFFENIIHAWLIYSSIFTVTQLQNSSYF